MLDSGDGTGADSKVRSSNTKSKLAHEHTNSKDEDSSRKIFDYAGKNYPGTSMKTLDVPSEMLGESIEESKSHL